MIFSLSLFHEVQKAEPSLKRFWPRVVFFFCLFVPPPADEQPDVDEQSCLFPPRSTTEETVRETERESRLATSYAGCFYGDVNVKEEAAGV